MNAALLAQVGAAGWSFGQIVITIIICCGIAAIGLIVCRRLNMWPPPWFMNILLIVALVVVACVAIAFLMKFLA